MRSEFYNLTPDIMRSNKSFPLISVIIPTFNAIEFLLKAIESALQQTYSNFEVLVIDDGSTDNTRLVIQDNNRIKYYHQENKGLSSARNLGIEKSRGDYLVFLDADDSLEKDALQLNYAVIQNKPGIAFVSGNYYLLRAESNELELITTTVTDDHYIRLLKSNYIGMHAAVMFQRWVFEHVRYDETLKACEDYDLYLGIARKYPVLHHQQFIATYYFHSSGISHDYQLMIDSINIVIKKQRPFVRTAEEKSAYLEGSTQWKHYYGLMKESL